MRIKIEFAVDGVPPGPDGRRWIAGVLKSQIETVISDCCRLNGLSLKNYECYRQHSPDAMQRLF